MPENVSSDSGPTQTGAGDSTQPQAGSAGSSNPGPAEAHAAGSTTAPDTSPEPAQSDQAGGAARSDPEPAASQAPADDPAQERAEDETTQQRVQDEAKEATGGGETKRADPGKKAPASEEAQQRRTADKGEGPESEAEPVDLSRAQLAFLVAGGTVDDFLVTRFRGSEGLCQLYRFEIELTSTLGQVALDDIVGKPAVLSINSPWGTRWFHGIIGRFEISGETPGLTHFRAELVPVVWLLTHRVGSRIFQNKTVSEIISDVLIRGGIASDQFKLELGRTYDPREYCVQYRETDYNFITRLMEEEGIRWYFEQSQDAHVLVITDGGADTSVPIEEDAALPYHPPTGMNVATEHVSRFRMGQAVRPGAVVLNDYSFKTPKLNLQTKSDCGRDKEYEFSDFPGEYTLQGSGQALATLRAEEFETSRTVGVGQSNCVRLAPGRTFELIEHPSALDGSYLLTTVQHQGKQATTRTVGTSLGRSGLLDARLELSLNAARQHEDPVIRELAEALMQIVSRIHRGDPTARRALTQWLYHAGQVSRDLGSIAAASGGSPTDALSIPNLLDDVAALSVVEHDAPVYQCRFECIPASVAYRPPRVTPWPVMRGAQTARVVGPSGEEIHTDEYGRVRVQFDWDREGGFKEDASCWIRVSQGSAGGQYGMMFIPRVGQEVVVDFLEGDPDKPLITGRVYNADHMPPYELPKEKTKSVIKTNTSKGGGGSNEIRFEDLKDKEQILLYAQKDLHVRANNDRVENIDHDRYLTVKENKFELVKKAKNNEVKLDFNEKVGGNLSLDVGGDVVEKFGMNHKNETTMTSATKAMSIKLEASVGIELKCGGSSIILTPVAIFIVGGPLVNINSGSGPPVGPVTATAAAPEAPVDADTTEPGKDVTYAGGEELAEGEVPADTAGHEFEESEPTEQKTSWIEMELRDDEGNPVAFERCRIKTTDGRVIERSTGEDGVLHIHGIKPGDCEITFPNLDKEAWGR